MATIDNMESTIGLSGQEKLEKKKKSAELGLWAREQHFQTLMSQYCATQPSGEAITKQYLREQEVYKANHPDEKFVDARPYIASPLGRDNMGTGDFVSVSQFCWDNHRLKNLKEERPQHDAYKRAIDRGGKDLTQENQEHLKKKAELKAKVADASDENMPGVSSLLKSMEETQLKKARLIPALHKPYEWDADNPNDGIPWPDVTPVGRSKGPAFQRIEKQASQKSSSLKKILDPFTGTYIIQHEEASRSKSLKLNYQPSLNAYVQGDLLAGLRNKKRHARITEAQEFLDETKLDERTREQRRKEEVKRRADEEYQRAREAVKEKKRHQRMKQEKLQNLDVHGKKGGFRSTSHRTSSAGSISSMSSRGSSISSKPNSRVNRPTSTGRPSTAGDNPDSTDILFIDSRPNTADSSANLNIDDEEIAKWEGTRVKTPIWGNFGNRNGSAGSTPWNRLGSAGAKKFTGWLGDLRDLINSRGSKPGTATTSGEMDGESRPETETTTPTNNLPLQPPDLSSPKTKSHRPGGRRRKTRRSKQDAPFKEAHSNDGSMMFDQENSANSIGSLESGFTACSFEFLEDGSDLSPSPERRKKKKKKKKKKKGFGDGSIGSLTTGSEFGDKKKKKKKKKKRRKGSVGSVGDSSFDDNSTIATIEDVNTKNENLTDYVNGPGMEVTTFEFIDDMSLASSMGTVRTDSPTEITGGRRSSRLSPLTLPPPLDELEEKRKKMEQQGTTEGEEFASNEKTPTLSGALVAATPNMKDLQARGRRSMNLTVKKAAKIESYLIKKKLWSSRFRITGRENYNKSAGFTKAAHDPLLQGKSITYRVGNLLMIGANIALKRAAYGSYMFVLLVGGQEAASTMGLRDFLIGRTMTGMEMVAAAGDAEKALVLRALTQIKGRVRVEVRDYGGRTALMRAVEGSCTDLTDKQLRDWFRSQRKQRVKFLRTRGSTPENVNVIRAMRAKKYDAVLELLLTKGADLNAKCIGNVDEDVTALHIAAEGGSVKRVKWLLAKGAIVDATTESKMTALHFAAKLGNCDAATYMLKQDANIIAKNDVGWTPLHFAAHSGGTQMVTLLLKAGADKMTEDKRERSAVMIAQQYGNRSSFEVLRKWNEEKFKVKESLDYLQSKMAG
ncbi:hypothetical protein TL16_g05107 [Triparma laevis f. inornata]|uniref:Uncharacterized protein n=1 Tax=Triparma laevis f. inornata TaxID=1714386 RepID=A0A9W7E7W0_9STRA|nr:hypothetical protein TL16_g05107 [Triparma laevis f. inornata]